MPGVDALFQRLWPSRWGEGFHPYYRADRISDAAIDWIDARGEAAFFLMVNYLDVHEPNRRPPTEHFGDEGQLDPATVDFDPLDTIAGALLPDEIREWYRIQYDRELEVLDRELARLLDHIADGPLAKRTTVIVTADHGEHLGERGWFGHFDIRAQTLDVPLLVRGDGYAPGRDHAPVLLSDLFPTILKGLGLSVPESGSARPILEVPPGRPQVAEWYAAENHQLREARFGGRFERDRWSYDNGTLRLRADKTGPLELFDPRADPDETRDLLAERPADAQALFRELEGWLARHPERPADGPAPTRPIDERHRRLLRALGYAE